VRQAKKKGDEEEDTRPGNNAEVRQLNGEVQKLNSKVGHQAEMIEVLKLALIGCMSRAMYDAYWDKVESLDDPVLSAPEEWKADAMTDAKHKGITRVVREMIHMTHGGPERKRQPSKLVVEAFGGVVGFNDYPYKDMVFDEKDDLNGMGINVFQYRLFLECCEIDWKQALEEGCDFHNYPCYMAGGNYLVEKVILQGQPLPHGHAGYVILEFP